MKIKSFVVVASLCLGPALFSACSTKMVSAPASPNAPLVSPSASPTSTGTPCASCPPSSTATPTTSLTPARTSTSTPTTSLTPTRTATSTPTPSLTPTRTTTSTPTPSLTPTRTATSIPTSTSTPGGTGVNLILGTGSREITSGVTLITADLQLSMGGAAVTNASVTMVTPYGNVPLAYNGTAVTIAHYTAGGFTYTPGQSYHFVVDGTPLGDFTTPSAVAPGGITIPASGSPLSWSVEGNYDAVVISSGATTLYSTATYGDEDSPFNAAPYLTASGFYMIAVSCNQSNSQVVGSTDLTTTMTDAAFAMLNK